MMRRLLSPFVVTLWLMALGLNAASAEDFLPPEQAFRTDLRVVDPQCVKDCRVDVRIAVAPGYYLYAERFKAEPLKGLERLALLNVPAGEKKFDINLDQEIEALRGDLQFQLAYDPTLPLSALQGNLVSQGCADAGLCYPPQTHVIPFETLASNVAASPAQQGVDEVGALAERLKSQSWWVVLPVFFGLGLLLAFTPCTLPMLPIVTSLVVGQQHTPGGMKGFGLALVYVLGMALTYAALGVLAGLTGSSLVVALQQPIVLWTFGGVLAALGMALLLGYSLQVPAGLQSWIQARTGRLQGGQALPVLVMGVLSALLLGPCVAPPLAGALLFIGQTGEAVLGGAALFALALGMGLPLVLLAGGAGRWLPRAGHWMNWVSAAFGFTLLATAIWVATPVTPVGLVMGAWVILGCVVAGACMQGVASGQLKSTLGNTVFRALALLSAGLALIYALALFSGGTSLLRPLAHWQANSGGSPVSAGTLKHLGPEFEEVESGQVMAVVQNSNQPVMLDFYADWCISCKEFEAFTLTDKQVQRALQGVRLLRVDVTANSAADQALLKQFSLFGPPALLFFKPGGEELLPQRVVGFQNATQFTETLTAVRAGFGLPTTL